MIKPCLGPNRTMPCVDVFHSDADGICALQQLRLQTPQPTAQLVTGVKRDIKLLGQIRHTSKSRITVLDISFEQNRIALAQVLTQDNQVLYIDHHDSGEIPIVDTLVTHIDRSPLVSTSLIVDHLLAGRYRPWAIVGAFGDNLDEEARRYAHSIGLSNQECLILKQIGMLLNYNSYGLTLADVLIHPADLFRKANQYTDPFDFYYNSGVLNELRLGYETDMAKTKRLCPYNNYIGGRIFFLPEAKWANRVIGVFANQLAHEQPTLAHAVLLAQPDNCYMVSVRAPLTTHQGAATLCRQFASGGGREAAAGINALSAQELDSFLLAFADHFPAPPTT